MLVSHLREQPTTVDVFKSQMQSLDTEDIVTNLTDNEEPEERERRESFEVLAKLPSKILLV